MRKNKRRDLYKAMDKLQDAIDEIKSLTELPYDMVDENITCVLSEINDMEHALDDWLSHWDKEA